jgi:hypothetical protein
MTAHKHSSISFQVPKMSNLWRRMCQALQLSLSFVQFQRPHTPFLCREPAHDANDFSYHPALCQVFEIRNNQMHFFDAKLFLT